MAYATQQDLISRFGQDEILRLSDRATPPADEIDAAVVAKALADADALIDSYVGRSYSLPLAAVPEILTRVACDLARFHLHDVVPPIDQVKAARDDAVKFLKDVADGKAKLAVGGEEPKPVSEKPAFVTAGRVFDRDTLGDY